MIDSIIDNKIKEMMIKFPDWERPDIDTMYTFSIKQAREMMEDMKNEILEETKRLGHLNKISGNYRRAINDIRLFLGDIKEKEK